MNSWYPEPIFSNFSVRDLSKLVLLVPPTPASAILNLSLFTFMTKYWLELLIPVKAVPFGVYVTNSPVENPWFLNSSVFDTVEIPVVWIAIFLFS